MPQGLARVVGSGYTTINVNGNIIAWLDSYVDSGQQPVVPPSPVHPLGDRHVREFATPRAIREGTLSITVTELWNEPIWWQFIPKNAYSDTPWDIIDVWAALSASTGIITAQTLIKPPGSSTWRGKSFLGCWITGIPDGDTVTLGSMDVPKAIVISYTHSQPLSVPATAPTV